MTEPYGNGQTVLWRIAQAEREIVELRATQDKRHEELSKKLDKILWAVISVIITIATAMFVFAIQNGTPGS